MLKRTKFNMTRENICLKKFRRELQEDSNGAFQRSLHVTDGLINRLGLAAELQGHTGCVNCLEWSEAGDLLASGSDDVHLIVWDPFLQKPLVTLPTGHTGNMFSVKFLPHSNNNMVVTGAADFQIRVHDIGTEETTQVFSCHIGRVKRIATAPNIPFLFWSASEDGTIMQFDLRSPESARSDNPKNVLINLIAHVGPGAEAKCIAINPLNPEQLAVGANDPFIRLYDRRMLSCRSIQYPREDGQVLRTPWTMRFDNSFAVNSDAYSLPEGCVQCFVAAHLPQKSLDLKKRFRGLAATYVTFSPNGAELLANIGGEQVYLFDINKRRRMQKFNIGLSTAKNGIGGLPNGISNNSAVASGDGALSANSGEGSSKTVTLPAHVDALKKEANKCFEKQDYRRAVMLYNVAIAQCPSAALLYSNRAAALIRRNWDGDIYAALRDCQSAIHLDPSNVKAHYRLAKCLFELSWPEEASECLHHFKTRFPDEAKMAACESLDRDICEAIATLHKVEVAETEKLSKNDDLQSSSSSDDAETANDTPRRRRRATETISDVERHARENAYDYEQRFCGHCNTTTDIKEANFFGSEGQYILAGSDDGSFFIWDKQTTNIMRILRGDDAIVNCLQPHPTSCLLATSGIDNVVRLWRPRAEDGSAEEREVSNQEDAASANQRRMNADPFEAMLSNMGYRLTDFIHPERDNEQEGDEGGRRGRGPVVQCPMS